MKIGNCGGLIEFKGKKMNALVEKHILQEVDWSKFDLEGWLYQFGAWMNTVSGTCGKSINPIAIAMDNVAKKRKSKKLTKAKEGQIIIDYLIAENYSPKLKRTKVSCQINDNEARAIQRLILDLKGQSDVLECYCTKWGTWKRS